MYNQIQLNSSVVDIKTSKSDYTIDGLGLAWPVMVAMESLVLSCRSGRKNSFWSRKGNNKRMGYASSHVHPAALLGARRGDRKQDKEGLSFYFSSIVEDSDAQRSVSVCWETPCPAPRNSLESSGLGGVCLSWDSDSV